MIRTWPRTCEILLAVWLIVSGWVMDQPGQYRIVSAAAGALVIALDVYSIRRRSYAYLLVLVVAAAPLVFGYLLPPDSAGAQNVVTVALLLLIFAILPTEATLPPSEWRQFRAGRRPDGP